MPGRISNVGASHYAWNEMRRLESHTRPPGDAYDGNNLVPPHFATSPQLTTVEEAYSVHSGNLFNIWSLRNNRIKARAPNIMASHNAPSMGRCGLYICGTPEQVVYRRGADGKLQNQERERMMVFAIELTCADRHKWQSIHAEMEALMLDVGIEKHHGVQIRYYLLEDRAFPAGPALRASTSRDDFSEFHEEDGELGGASSRYTLPERLQRMLGILPGNTTIDAPASQSTWSTRGAVNESVTHSTNANSSSRALPVSDSHGDAGEDNHWEDVGSDAYAMGESWSSRWRVQ